VKKINVFLRLGKDSSLFVHVIILSVFTDLVFMCNVVTVNGSIDYIILHN
jgi:hypothetical protein